MVAEKLTTAVKCDFLLFYFFRLCNFVRVVQVVVVASQNKQLLSKTRLKQWLSFYLTADISRESYTCNPTHRFHNDIFYYYL